MNKSWIVVVSVIISALLGVPGSKGQTKNSVPPALYGPTSSIVRIRSGEKTDGMGFVVGKNLIITVISNHASVGDLVAVIFETLPGPTRRPIGRFNSFAKVTRIDHSQLALLSVNTSDAIPLALAPISVGSESIYSYVEKIEPNRNEFHGAIVIFANIVTNPGNDFRSIPGAPVLNARGEIAGITVAKCDVGREWKTCFASVRAVRKFIDAIR